MCRQGRQELGKKLASGEKILVVETGRRALVTVSIIPEHLKEYILGNKLVKCAVVFEDISCPLMLTGLNLLTSSAEPPLLRPGTCPLPKTTQLT